MKVSFKFCPKCAKDLANNKEIKVRDESSGKKTRSSREFKETKEKQTGHVFQKRNLAEEKGTANRRKISVILSRLLSVLWYRIAVT